MKKKVILGLLCCANLFAQDLDYKYDFSGRLEYDIGHFDTASDSYKESDFRRARISHKGSFFDKTLFYKLAIDGSDDIEFKDNYVGYKNKIDDLNFNYRLKLGNMKVPFSFDAYAGSKYSSFMESPLTDTLTQNRKVGIEALLSQKDKYQRANLYLGTFINSIDEQRDDDEGVSRNVVKATYSYKFEKNHVIHVGSSFLYSDINGENVKYSQESESSLIQDKYISTKVKDVDNTKDLSLEALYINDSFHAQAEYVQSRVNASSNNYSFDGYYAQAGYFLFGSSKTFKQADSKFSGKNIIDNDVELAFRYSYLDLNDKDEQGGTQKDYNFALNWYINRNLKFMTNYIIAYPNSDDYDGALSLVQARVALTF